MPIFPKSNEFSHNFNKKSPFKVIPLLVTAGTQILGSILGSGARKDALKAKAADTEAKSTQFQTPETKTRVDTGKYSSGPVNQPLNLPEVPKNKGFNF